MKFLRIWFVLSKCFDKLGVNQKNGLTLPGRGVLLNPQTLGLLSMRKHTRGSKYLQMSSLNGERLPATGNR